MSLFLGPPLDWARDGADWPNRNDSTFVTAAGLRWHVQRQGKGPQMLLLHGTAAASHSWRDLMPALARRFTVVAPDLPGHGFTAMPPRHRLALPGMAKALAGLLEALDVRPAVVVGHSAGAAIAARLCLDKAIDPALLVSLNGAWLPFPGSSGILFPLLARALFLNPLTPRVFAAMADRHAVKRLITQTGSNLDDRGIALYGRLLRNPVHVSGSLGMMANWDLDSLNAALPKLTRRIVLMVGENDLAVPPSGAETVRRRVPDGTVLRLRDLGHLAHEESPAEVAAEILAAAEAVLETNAQPAG